MEVYDTSFNPEPTQLDRIEAKLDKLLAKKKRKPRDANLSPYSKAFQEAWAVYPKVSGANKALSYLQYNKRLEESQFPVTLSEAILKQVVKYAAFISATGTFVKLPQTFFGVNKHYENDWTIPKPKADPYAKPEIFSQSHQKADFSRDVENSLDTSTNPYGDMK